MISAAQIRLLRVAQKQAGFDNDTYHDFLEKHAGVRSSKLLTNKTFDIVKRAFERETGFQSIQTERPARRPRSRRYEPNATITPEQQQLIAALYEELGWTDISRQIGFSKRCCKKSFPQKRSDAIKVIEGLKAIVERERRSSTEASTNQQTHLL